MLLKTLKICLFFQILFTSTFAQNKATYLSHKRIGDMAKMKGYVKKDKSWHDAIFTLDTATHIWVMTQLKTMHIKQGPCNLTPSKSEPCDCKNTNGCTDQFMYSVRFNAFTGKRLSVRTKRTRFANYE